MVGDIIESMYIKIEILVQMIVVNGRFFIWWINACYFLLTIYSVSSDLLNNQSTDQQFKLNLKQYETKS